MNILIYINAKKLNKNLKAAMDEYTKRLSAYCKIKVLCIPAGSAKDLTDLPIRIDQAIQSDHSNLYRIRSGKDTISSEEFSLRIEELGIRGISQLLFFIGYPGIHTNESDSPAIQPFSLTSVDLSTDMTAVVLCEQLYRSYRIMHHQPYHK